MSDLPPPAPSVETPSGAPVTTTPPPPARRSRRWLVLAGLAVVGAVGLAGWRYAVTRPDYLYQQARRILEEQARREPKDRDYNRVWEIAERLAEGGETDRPELLRGEALVAQGQYPLAMERLNRVREDPALKLRAAFLQGRCLLELQQNREANRVLAWALEQSPDDIDGNRAMAAVAYDLGQVTRAERYLKKWAELVPADGRPFRLLGLIAKDAADFESALSAYQEALSRDLSDDFRRAIYLEQAEIFHEQKKPAEVLKALDRLAALSPAPPPRAAFLRAMALVRQNKRAEALAVVTNALKEAPRDAELWTMRGDLELQSDPKQAVTSLEEAVRLAPSGIHSHLSYHLLGRAYAGVGRKDDARRANEKAEALRKKLDELTQLTREASARPWDAKVRSRLGQLWEELGDARLAERWNRAARDCRPD